jgi:rod shape-determining protein MreC
MTMRPIPVEPPAFFHRGPTPLTRLAFFGVLSIALLFADTRYRYLENIRQVAAAILYPVQRAVEMPVEAVVWVGRYFADKARLADENVELRQSLMEQAPNANALPQLRDENAHLRALLDLASRYGGDAIAVEVLYTGRDPFAQKLFVNKGAQAGVVAGEAVVDDRGVVGQVTRVFPYMSEVTLVTDKDQAVPVKVERSGIRSVLFGNGTARAPELRFTAPSADVKVGDHLLTSGIDGTYPANLPVAEVIDIERDTGQMFARIAVRPLAGVDRSQYLMVLGQSAATMPRPEEPAESDTVKRGRGRARRG